GLPWRPAPHPSQRAGPGNDRRDQLSHLIPPPHSKEKRMSIRIRRSPFLMPLAAAACLLPLQPSGAGLSVRSAGAAPAITLEVDARDAPQKIFHSRLVIPASPGPPTLYYPTWIPGEHGPTGPITDLAGLRVSVGGKTVPWRRDDVDMYTFHLDVPAGANALEVALDFLLPAGTEGFSSAASSSADLAVLSW